MDFTLNVLQDKEEARCVRKVPKKAMLSSCWGKKAAFIGSPAGSVGKRRVCHDGNEGKILPCRKGCG